MLAGGRFLLRSALASPRRCQVDNVQRALLSTSSDNKHFLVNALGDDKLGIVSSMTKTVMDNGGSVGESQATRLGQYFSHTMLISVPTSTADNVLSAFKSGISDMNTNIIETSDPSISPTPTVGYSGRFTLSGADHPGLVHSVTSLLADHGLNIEVMETSEDVAPHGGTTLFSVEGIATAYTPLLKGFNTELIGEKLSDLGESLNCDISLEDNITRKTVPKFDVWENIA